MLCYRSIMSAMGLKHGFSPAFRLARVEPV